MPEPMITLATAVASKAVTAALEPFIRQLLDIQENQGQTLARLEDGVRALVEAPWRESKLHLLAAESAGSSDVARRNAELGKAADALLSAYSAHPRPSVTRALIAADTATLEAMLGRPTDAKSWASTAHTDIVSYLHVEAARVQSTLNQRPTWPVRARRILHSSIWDEVLGTLQKEPEPQPRADDTSTTALIVRDTIRKRAFLESGPDTPPGWVPLPNSKWPEPVRWRSPADPYSLLFFEPDNGSFVAAIVELHRAAAHAETLRRVAEEFGCRDLPTGWLQVKLRNRYHAIIEYVSGQDVPIQTLPFK